MRQQQEQIAALQVLLAERREEEGAEAAISQPNTRLNIEVTKLQIFNEEASKVLEFLTAYRLYIRIRMRDVLVEKQVQQVLSYVQRKLANVQKKNMIENLESGSLSYITVGKFFLDLKEEFDRGEIR